MPRVCSIVIAMLLGCAALPLRGEAPATQRPLVRDFLGICGHTVVFKPELYAPICSLARDYHPVEWDLDGHTEQLPDFPMAKNKVSWQDVYGSWAKAKFRTNVCLMFDSVKPDRWHDLEADSAAYGRVFGSYFGPSAKGKGLQVESVEIGNEPGNYSDAQYTALLRAVAPALRKADRNLRIATCNLTTGKSGGYAKSVATLTADPAILPALDILTIHTYAQAEPWPTWRRSYPEDPTIPYLKDVNDLARWRDEHAAGKAVWITEFGYDATIRKPDPKTEFAKWQGVSDTQQAQYLVRSVLLFTALPVERAYLYFFDDNDEPKLHGSSGITRNFVPKPSYYALAQLQATLGDYRLGRVLLEKPGELYAYEFVQAKDPGKMIVVAWSPTGKGREATVAVPLPGHRRIARAQRMVLTKDAPVDLAVPSAQAVPIDENPLYLFLTSAL